MQKNSGALATRLATATEVGSGFAEVDAVSSEVRVDLRTAGEEPGFVVDDTVLSKDGREEDVLLDSEINGDCG